MAASLSNGWGLPVGSTGLRVRRFADRAAATQALVAPRRLQDPVGFCLSTRHHLGVGAIAPGQGIQRDDILHRAACHVQRCPVGQQVGDHGVPRRHELHTFAQLIGERMVERVGADRPTIVARGSRGRQWRDRRITELQTCDRLPREPRGIVHRGELAFQNPNVQPFTAEVLRRVTPDAETYPSQCRRIVPRQLQRGSQGRPSRGGPASAVRSTGAIARTARADPGKSAGSPVS